MNRIRLLCNITIITLIPLTLYYVYIVGGWALNEAFLKPELWLSDGWVDADAQISPLTRAVFFVLWCLPIVFGLFGYGMALRLALLVRRGVMFDARVAGSILFLGVGVICSALLKIFAACLSPMIKSWHNPAGPLPLRFWYGSEEFALVVCGFGFLIFGLVMREAIKLARENEAFV